MNKCPFCDYVNTKKSNVNRHIARMHPDRVITPPAEKPAPPVGDDSAQVFNVKKPAEATRDYHCIGCGAKLTKGQTPCPECGEDLIWDGID